MNPKQFGKKVGKHAQDYGLDPSSENDREKMREIITDIIDNHNEIRRGTWPGQSGEVEFFIKGRDVVISNGGEFVSVLKDGITNGKVIRARRWQDD
ncbi:MAG: hypothetical protein LBE35_11250 [Clostridiales bacterium]|jgi:predicted metal-dependent RNase|nr:hypothetical protein [Clostridiales bacterium]